MGNTPAYTRGTEEGELLSKLSLQNETGKSILSPEEQAILLQSNNGIYDYAMNVKEDVEKISSLSLSKNEPSNDLLSSNHPRSGGLNEWLASNPENKKWYDENFGKNFNLVDGGRIELLGDIFAAEDEKAPDNGKDTWDYNGNILFDGMSAYRQSKGKRIPDWNKYLSFLPGNDENKVDFLINVLGLKLAGFYNGLFNELKRKDMDGGYWSARSMKTDIGSGDCLRINKDFYTISFDSITFGYTLRLLEN